MFALRSNLSRGIPFKERSGECESVEVQALRIGPLFEFGKQVMVDLFMACLKELSQSCACIPIMNYTSFLIDFDLRQSKMSTKSGQLLSRTLVDFVSLVRGIRTDDDGASAGYLASPREGICKSLRCSSLFFLHRTQFWQRGPELCASQSPPSTAT